MTFETITECGKFEGELSCVPEMWEIANEGLGGDVYVSGIQYSFVTLMSIMDTVEFEGGIVDGLFGACLWEDEQGFVHSKWFANDAEYCATLDAMRDEARNESFEDGDEDSNESMYFV